MLRPELASRVVVATCPGLSRCFVPVLGFRWFGYKQESKLDHGKQKNITTPDQNPQAPIHTPIIMTPSALNAGPPSLPPELVALIINEVHDDKRTLADCTLVSRAWLAPASKHLFREIDIRGRAQFNSFRAFLDSADFPARLVKRLVFGSYHSGAGEPSEEEPPMELDAFALATILEKLPGVEEVTLYEVSILPVRDATQVSALDSWAPRPMKSVSLDLITFNQPIYESLLCSNSGVVAESLMLRELHRILSLFSSVSKLHLEIDFLWMANLTPHALGSRPQLTNLRVQELTLNADACVVDMIRRSGAVTSQNLKTLQCLPYEDCSKDAMQKLLDSSPGLTHLRFVQYHPDGPETNGMPTFSFNLSPNKSIQSIHFEARLIPSPYPVHFATLYLAPWLQTLSTVNPNAIREITFDLRMPTPTSTLPQVGNLRDKVLIEYVFSFPLPPTFQRVLLL
ncbi:hypothetical protein BXZ70DRAFT_739091 [Cristinia sonorae]|uniref:F-box domain-containing protein n=1 Tax=Cristinia sonorae TaxID=1940300 RepID=A0A8K0UTJ7_9AGAR|nr:hypothetical protein BXZ70DRAFT_739091 [Cristinia sonorae]